MPVQALEDEEVQTAESEDLSSQEEISPEDEIITEESSEETEENTSQIESSKESQDKTESKVYEETEQSELVQPMADAQALGDSLPAGGLDLADGSITVTSATTVTQKISETNTKEYNFTEGAEIVIFQSDATTATTNTITVADNCGLVNIALSGVNIQCEFSYAFYIGKENNTKVTVNDSSKNNTLQGFYGIYSLSDVQIFVNGMLNIIGVSDTGIGIKIENESNLLLTGNGNIDIKGQSDGIEIGSGNLKLQNSQTTITAQTWFGISVLGGSMDIDCKRMYVFGEKAAIRMLTDSALNILKPSYSFYEGNENDQTKASVTDTIQLSSDNGDYITKKYIAALLCTFDLAQGPITIEKGEGNDLLNLKQIIEGQTYVISMSYSTQIHIIQTDYLTTSTPNTITVEDNVTAEINISLEGVNIKAGNEDNTAIDSDSENKVTINIMDGTTNTLSGYTGILCRGTLVFNGSGILDINTVSFCMVAGVVEGDLIINNGNIKAISTGNEEVALKAEYGDIIVNGGNIYAQSDDVAMLAGSGIRGSVCLNSGIGTVEAVCTGENDESGAMVAYIESQYGFKSFKEPNDVCISFPDSGYVFHEGNNLTNNRVDKIQVNTIVDEDLQIDSHLSTLNYVKVDREVTLTYTATKGGNISRTSETIGRTSDAQGSIATADEGYTFTGWYDESGALLGTDESYIPVKQSQGIFDSYLTATYIAKFEKENTTLLSDGNLSSTSASTQTGQNMTTLYLSLAVALVSIAAIVLFFKKKRA